MVKFPAQNLSIRCYYRHFFLCLCLCLSPYHFLFKKKRNKEGLRWYLLGWLVMRKLEENHYLVILMGLWIEGWSWDLGGVFHGVDILFYFPQKKKIFYFTKYCFFVKAFAWFENKRIGQVDNGWIESLSARWVGGGEGKTGVGPTNGEPKFNILVLLALLTFLSF